MIRLGLALILAPAAAGAFSLALPVDCTPGADCFVQQYPDRDPGPGAVDFTCGPLTYDTHSGTDFAVPTLADIRAGVTVRAAAAGVVRGTRDGMPDIAANDPAAPPLQGRDCGNGMVIDHGDGWETQYCHLARGSVLPRSGDRVEAGQPLGRIGLSGRTEFPHLHLSVRRGGAEVDPFDPDGTFACGEAPAPALWEEPLPYRPGGLIGLGLADRVPQWAAIKAGGLPAGAAAGAPALVVWAHYFGSRAGDRISLSITAPDGAAVIAETVDLNRTQAQGFRAVGRRARGPWAPGDYRLEARLLRDGAVLETMTATMPVR
jgi:hypothetical protein